MKRYCNKLAYAVLAMAAVAVAGCSDDDHFNKWQANYVYLMPQNLGLLTTSYTLDHTGDDGITGPDTEMTFTVCLNKAEKQNVTVGLDMELSENLPAEKVHLPASVTIPAGTLSVPVTLSVPDWVFESGNKLKTEYSVIVKLRPTDSEDILIGNQSQLEMLVTKNAYLNMASGTPTGTAIADRSVWTITIDPTAENANNPGWLVDGSTSTDIAKDGTYWFTVDLGGQTAVTGFRIRYYGTAYAARGVEISVSDDGTNWLSQGDLAITGSDQYIHFLETPSISCRWVRYEATTNATSGRMSVTEFYVYEE